MAVTAKMVKDLREQTGAGMMDCKKALSETNGDMDAAVEYLRKNGQAKAEKQADRIEASNPTFQECTRCERTCSFLHPWRRKDRCCNKC